MKYSQKMSIFFSSVHEKDWLRSQSVQIAEKLYPVRIVGRPRCSIADGTRTGKPRIFSNAISAAKDAQADVLCKRCSSWKLVTLGISIESAEREIKKKFPDIPLFVMDKDHVKTHKQAEAISKKFYDSPEASCLGRKWPYPISVKK